ncbi:RNA methyltransferase [Winogradskyella sp. J14-2]|uniref:TrmH family RNA methyltransferase n=1 Tax=Winogradskyella sp. J14-2 TaxID=1936080 RepID=UPI000972A02F|nr:RNA methyltransferase [Winogradskyella sp. J14-2]APY07911.1 RNA methyltransferase [Winogradskyella sp. J14-2]
MVTKQEIKVIKSLSQKKYRQQLELFTVEGVKGIEEFLNSNIKLSKLYTTKQIFSAPKNQIIEISGNELRKISALKNPNTALAVFEIPKPVEVEDKGLIVALDDVRDPGNLGTIIRLCDWYGVKNMVCSNSTVDCYNPKVVQATMGSLTRVNITYTELSKFIQNRKVSVFGTYMNGESIYNAHLPNEALIVFGNEANGISETINSIIDKKITIPQFGIGKDTESLNVANAAAIVLSEFRRRTIEM